MGSDKRNSKLFTVFVNNEEEGSVYARNYDSAVYKFMNSYSVPWDFYRQPSSTRIRWHHKHGKNYLVKVGNEVWEVRAVNE